MEIRVQNVKDYVQVVDGDDLLFIPKENYLTETEISELLIDSHVECNITWKDNQITNKGIALRCIREVLIEIWKLMPAQKILQNTTFNFKLNNEDGYTLCPEINMYFQYKNTKGSFQELIKMVNVNKMNMTLKVTLKSGRIVYN